MTQAEIDDLLTRMIQFNSGKAFEFERQVDNLINVMKPFNVGDTAVSAELNKEFTVVDVFVEKIFEGAGSHRYLDHILITSVGSTESGYTASNCKTIKLKPPRLS